MILGIWEGTMGRKVLMKGDTINGEFQYEIESVSGTGASCIVYKARYYDKNKQSHLVQIKEFYPCNLEIYREKNNNNLICADTERFKIEKERFLVNAKKLAELNNDETTNSVTPFQSESFEANNTGYSVVAYGAGNIYSEENLQTMELAKLLEIIKNLARAVELFHKNGYVHLDIKPENFLVDNTDHITLFDIDSVTSCDEINNEIIQNISHTKKWAAPEVRQAAEKGKNTNISYTADIYSIGLILFEAIMCRDFIYPVETLPYSRNWDIENSIKAREEKQNRKVNINPKFYHKIKEIFEKTLDRNLSKRYNSAQELYDNLDKARDLLKEKPWIIPSDRTVTPQFTGRKNELVKMNSILKKENTVFLHGFAGIGKSELALKYAEVYKDDFDTVVFCKYENSIKEALLNIRIANYPNDSNTMYLRKVAELCDERTLIILDNFDVETDADDYLYEFINNYRCKKIVTTRTNFSKRYKQIDVEALGEDDAILLFEKESKWIPKTGDEEKSLDEILKLIGYHTYFTVILANKKEMFSLSIDELKKQAEEMLLKKSGRVTVAKDDKLTTDTIYAMAEKLFDFESISKSERQTLHNLYMLRWRTISRNDYAEIAGFGMSDDEKVELMDSLNDLTRLGWVLYNEKTDDFFLHPIMQELVSGKIEPEINGNQVERYYAKEIDLIAAKQPGERRTQRWGKEQLSYYFDRKIKEVLTFYENIKGLKLDDVSPLLRLLEAVVIEGGVILSDALHHYISSLLLLVYKIKSAHLIEPHTDSSCRLIRLCLILEWRWILHDEKDIMYFIREYINFYKEMEKVYGWNDKSASMFWNVVNDYISTINSVFKKPPFGRKLFFEHFFQDETLHLRNCIENVVDHLDICRKARWANYKAIFDSCINNTFNKFLNSMKGTGRIQLYEESLSNLQLNRQELLEICGSIMNDDILDKHEKKVLLRKAVLNFEEIIRFNYVNPNHVIMPSQDAADLILHVYECGYNSKENEFSLSNKIKRIDSVLVLAQFVKNRENVDIYLQKYFENQLSELANEHYDNLKETELICRTIDSLTNTFWGIKNIQAIYPFCKDFLTREIRRVLHNGENAFDLYRAMRALEEELYLETGEEKYHAMACEYDSKMKQISSIDYEIKD